MKTASIRDLRTQFPKVRRLLEQEGEIIITDRGQPVVVLRPYAPPPRATAKALDYYARLRRRMPRPLSAKARRELDEANRGER
jgi:antitoxin (DNA-binding transcriptional repressor) of toxin-antitoxin stability system